MNFLKTFILIISFSFQALAYDFQEKFQDWTFFRIDKKEDNKILCYLLSIPINRGSIVQKRGEAFIIITHVENDVDEISISSGVTYGDKSDVEMSFGKRKYYLLTLQSRAWAYDKNDDIDIVKQMKTNADVVVSGTSNRDEYVSDTYSLIGFADAYAKMKNSCK